MAFLKTTYSCFARRPFLIIYIAALSLFYSVFQIFNPLIGILQNISAINSDSWTDSLVYISKELYTVGNIALLLPIAGITAAILALISGVLASGLMNMYYETLRGGKENTVDLILEGIKKGFLKVSFIFLELYLSVIALILIIPLTSVPAIIISQKTIENGNSNIFTTKIIAILTVAVLFSALALIVMSYIFRFPSVFYFLRRPIEKSKNVVSTAFWRYFGAVCLLTALILMNEFMLLGIDSRVLEFFIGWITHTVLLAAVSAVSFTGYHMMLRRFRRD
ncbi:MAG: hypothetical protein JXB33_04960 [Clostridia bacterium]|nr:hypothetical protein [Clostridia bacterium]